MKFQIITAEIKFISIYKCHICGVCASGSTGKAHFEAGSSEQLRTLVDGLPQRAAQMPTGWGSYMDGFECPRCIKRKEKT